MPNRTAPVRATLRQRFAAATFGLPGVFWTLWALYGAGMTIAGPLGGLLADRIGRRATMLAGLLLGGGAVGVLAFAPWCTGR
jgi:MFS family permease